MKLREGELHKGQMRVPVQAPVKKAGGASAGAMPRAMPLLLSRLRGVALAAYEALAGGAAAAAPILPYDGPDLISDLNDDAKHAILLRLAPADVARLCCTSKVRAVNAAAAVESRRVAVRSKPSAVLCGGALGRRGPRVPLAAAGVRPAAQNRL